MAATSCLDPAPGHELDYDSEEEISCGPCTAPADPVIHSGHFMVSRPHSDSRRHRTGNSCNCQTRFDHSSIDPTLTRLFECMSLTYSGKIVSPKWKSFKGIRLPWRDKIRLNNAIWRAWYIQYIERRKTPVCSFVTPLEGSEADEHRKPEAIVLEGKYWKRRIEVVIQEYHKWRIYHKRRLHKVNQDGDLLDLPQADYALYTESWHPEDFQESLPMQEGGEAQQHLLDLDHFISDISDTLFTMTQTPWQLGTQNAYTSNADVIQPDLTPLQPNLDDFMDISDILSTRRPAMQAVNYLEQSFISSMSQSLCTIASATSSSTTIPKGTIVAAGTHVQVDCVSENCDSIRLSKPVLSTLPLAPHTKDFSLSSLVTDVKHKPLLPYSIPMEYPSSAPVGDAVHYAHCSPLASPDVIAMNQEHPCSLAFCPRFHSASTVLSSMNARCGFSYTSSPVSSSTPCFAQLAQGSLYTSATNHSHQQTDPQEYPLSANTPFVPSLCENSYFPVPKELSVTGKCHQKQRTTSMKSKRIVMSHGTHSMPSQNACLGQLLSADKHESAMDPPPQLNNHLTPEITPTNGILDFHCSSTRRLSQPDLINSSALPVSSCPLSGPVSLQNSLPNSLPTTLLTPVPGPSPAAPLVIPKREKLSPLSTCVNNRRNSGPVSPAYSTVQNHSPQSPHSTPNRSKLDLTKTETRRITHISAEQKRRFNIKLGFDTLHSFVTSLSPQPSIKISKATMLQKTAEYIFKHQHERAQMQEEVERLKAEIEELNATINNCQLQLPATGVPITRQRFDQMRKMFDDYVRVRTLHNWKFWIFSIIINPLFESFNGMVSTTNTDDLCRTTLTWLDQYCSLPALRPIVLSSLRQLSTSTSILSDPALVPEQATRAVSGSSVETIGSISKRSPLTDW